MRISDFLATSNVALDVGATDKTGLLKDLANRAAMDLKLSANDLSSALQKRDELGSTGIGGGVSIPHARLREVEKPYGRLVRLKTPIDFNAIDGQPVDIVFLLLLPASSQLDQLNALASVARKLREPEVLESLRHAKDRTEMYRVITS